MHEQLRYDIITGLLHHKKRIILVIAGVIFIYVFMAFKIGRAHV